MQELKRCPFCGVKLVQTVWDKTIFEHPENRCILTYAWKDGRLEISDKFDVDSWNRRATYVAP